MESVAANPAKPSGAEGSRPRKTKRRLNHENHILLLAFAGGAAGVLSSVILLWTGDFSDSTRWTITMLIVFFWLVFAFSVRSAVVRPLQTLSNMQSALREGDFSFRVRGASSGDALGELMLEVNTLSEMLREQRLGALEASALLSTVMTEIDVAVFAFDGGHRLRLVNRAGERILAERSERLLGKTAGELGMDDCLDGESARTLERNFAGMAGRWGMRRSTFRQGGVPHFLVVLTDLSRTLREEERQAWQRLVRVLGHELNNSLAPICSIAGSLEDIVKRDARPPDWEEDLRRGLRVIAERSDALSRFMKDYGRLARLPKPQIRPIPISTLINTAVGLERRMPIEIIQGPDITLQADPDQIQQLLINLIRNAVDASLETGGGVSIGWSRNGSSVEVFVQDQGPGIANPSNLFVPFFTTKPSGSGIGLALSRQIAEAHGGNLTLANRSSERGCRASLRLPLAPELRIN
ncbi:MAG TPA: ATP-binding protein [Terriglobales bacterium]|jgi:nitrogen fixation/metabolism regulation signal transduction histidine kinase